ncbi:hypothetical protein AB0R12_41600 [Streptomyces niveus]|uniref:hypothetical protein n=1 Tax=Streptomyces niveus TaxID=193462 RepID=UPI003419545E
MSSPFKASVVKAAQAGDERARDQLGHEVLPLVHQLVGPRSGTRGRRTRLP